MPDRQVAPGPEPQVQVFAAYFPQWHATPLNDYWFGENYTDWDLLCRHQRTAGGINRLGHALPTPMPPPQGLGWYDLRDKSVRQRQGLLARQYGIYGFAMYHFWFSRRWRLPDTCGVECVR